jgi:hypothetical protein
MSGRACQNAAVWVQPEMTKHPSSGPRRSLCRSLSFRYSSLWRVGIEFNPDATRSNLAMTVVSFSVLSFFREPKVNRLDYYL